MFNYIKYTLVITILLSTFNNCGQNKLGPSVEIDLNEKNYYKAIEPNYPQACIEIQIPLKIDKEDIKAEVLRSLDQNNFDDQLNSSIDTMETQLSLFGITSPFNTTEPFASDNIVVESGKCPAAGADPVAQNCTKRISGIPFNNYYKLITYVEELNPFSGFFEIHPLLQSNVCPSL